MSAGQVYLSSIATELYRLGYSDAYISKILNEEQQKLDEQGKRYLITQSKLEKARYDFWTFLECMKIGNEDYSFLDLTQDWEKVVIGTFQEIITSSEIDRGIFNLTPRLGKTTLLTELGGAFWLGREKFKLAVVNANFDKVNEINAKIKQIANTEIYQDIFKVKDTAPKNATRKIALSNGSMASFKVSGSNVIGSGYNGIIFDDFLNPNNERSLARKEQAKMNLSSFLSRKEYRKQSDGTFQGTKLLIIEQRLSTDDTTSICKSKWDEFNIAYRHISLPFYFTENTKIGNFEFKEDTYIDKRFNDKVKNEIIAERGLITFETQYQQNPQVNEGAILQPYDLSHTYQGHPMEMASNDYFDRIYVSCDTAEKAGKHNDNSCFTVAGTKNGDIYILDVITFKAEYEQIISHAENIYWKYNPDFFLIEDKSSGSSLLSRFKSKPIVNPHNGEQIYVKPIATKPDRSKIDRLYAVMYFFQTKRVLVPEYADWLMDWKTELLAFPNGKHDDRVDSITHLLDFIQQRAKNTTKIYA